MLVTKSTATVYSVPLVNRRFLSRRAAIEAYCRNRVRAKHTCECENDVGFTCGIHKSPGYEWLESLKTRYFRYVLYIESKAGREALEK